MALYPTFTPTRMISGGTRWTKGGHYRLAGHPRQWYGGSRIQPGTSAQRVLFPPGGPSGTLRRDFADGHARGGTQEQQGDGGDEGIYEHLSEHGKDHEQTRKTQTIGLARTVVRDQPRALLVVPCELIRPVVVTALHADRLPFHLDVEGDGVDPASRRRISERSNRKRAD